MRPRMSSNSRVHEKGVMLRHDLTVGVVEKHSGQMKRVFSELSPEELRGLEVALNKVGKRAALMEERG